MPSLEKLFRVLIDNRMDALALEPGDLPVLRQGESEHRVTKTTLEGESIRLLLNELEPDPPLAADGEAGETRGFGYTCDGVELRVQATRGEKGWSAVVARAEAAEAGPEPASRPAPAASETGREPAPAAAAAAPAEAAATAGETAPVTSIPDLLRELVERGGSDLHLTSQQPPRIRLHGELETLAGYAAPESEELKKLLFEITPERSRDQFESTNDTDFAFELPGTARFRINLFRDRLGVGAVMRVIPTEIPGFGELGIPEVMRQVVHLTKGLVLVTGPTGSGKSTTLAALIDLINRERYDHIVTIEDPIEFVHPSRRCLVNQREVGVHTQSFKKALRAALREDPDIVLVGEMRDLETTSTAIETAETGHLVFGTLHTTTAPSTVERLIDQFPADRQGQIRMMLAESLFAVVAQTLLRRIGGGRVAAFEVLVGTPAVSNLIREGKTFQIASAMQTGRRQGMRLLNESLIELVKKKLVEPLEAYRKSVEKNDLLAKLKAEGIELDTGTAGGSS